MEYLRCIPLIEDELFCLLGTIDAALLTIGAFLVADGLFSERMQNKLKLDNRLVGR